MKTLNAALIAIAMIFSATAGFAKAPPACAQQNGADRNDPTTFQEKTAATQPSGNGTSKSTQTIRDQG